MLEHLLSERLRIIPLSKEQLRLLLIGRNVLEQSMGLSPSLFELNAEDSFLQEFVTALENHVIPSLENQDSTQEWFTHWLIVHDQVNLTIGGIGFAGFPDEKGKAMLGYFIDKKFEGRGFASEAVSTLLAWAIQHPDLKAVIADTLPDGIGSQKVLKKNGFVMESQGSEEWRWIFMNPDNR